MSYRFNNAIDLIRHERNRQTKKYGEVKGIISAEKVVSILTEELGEFTHAINRAEYISAKTELVQLAAVAVKYIENFDLLVAQYSWSNGEILPPKPTKIDELSPCPLCNGTGLLKGKYCVNCAGEGLMEDPR